VPTENERKYIISTSCEDSVDALASKKCDIAQGYLIATRGITVRVRKSTVIGTSKSSYYMTMKVGIGSRIVEVENKLDERDFNDLWSISLNKLEKIRYYVKHLGDTWELDFFKDYQGKTYIAVAEIELPEAQLEPKTVPSIVEKNLIHKVALTDSRFSNKLLGDVRYSLNILGELNAIRNC
jgi:CYTH domain-containing protein